MTPCAIHGRQGETRLLGFPIVDGFEEQRVSGYDALLAAREFFTTHAFEDRTGLKIVTVLGAFDEVFLDDDGLVEKNLRLGKVTLEELFPAELDADAAATQTWLDETTSEAHTGDKDEEYDGEVADEDFGDERFPNTTTRVAKMTEKRVPVGEEVCAIGVYSDLYHGLVPYSASKPNRLFRGTAEQLERRSRSLFVRNILGGLIGMAVIHGLIVGGLALYRRSPEFQKHQDRKAREMRQLDQAEAS
jgi:hypothetical protein